MMWRFSNRKNPFLFRDTMKQLIQSDNIEYKQLNKGCLVTLKPSGCDVSQYVRYCVRIPERVNY